MYDEKSKTSSVQNVLLDISDPGETVGAYRFYGSCVGAGVIVLVYSIEDRDSFIKILEIATKIFKNKNIQFLFWWEIKQI